MKKRLLSLSIILCMVLSLLPAAQAAGGLPPEEGAYWHNLTTDEANSLVSSVYRGSEDHDVIFVYYRLSGCYNSDTYVPQYAAFAQEKQIEMCGYALDDSDPSSGLGSTFWSLLGANSLTFPAFVVYNAQTQRCTTADGAGVLSLRSFTSLLTQAGLYGDSDDGGESGGNGDNGDAAPSIPTLNDPSISPEAWGVLRLTNIHRMEVGLSPLSTFDDLQKVANQRAYECLDLFSHTRPDGTSCFTAYDLYGLNYRAVAENIAAGQRGSAAVMNSWLNSSGHRANIENGSLAHLGVGYMTGGTNGYGNAWCQNFATGRSCSHSGLTLSTTAIQGHDGLSLEALLEEADVTLTYRCGQYGTCRLPLIAAMCSEYDPDSTQAQTLTVTCEGETATLTVSNSQTTPPAPETYTVTVTGGVLPGGALTGQYEAGAAVTVYAGAAPQGQQFKDWSVFGVAVDDPTQTTLTFTMPANDVTLTANFEALPLPDDQNPDDQEPGDQKPIDPPAVTTPDDGPTQDPLPFTDVEPGWYYDSVRYVYEHGLISGVTEDTFAPGLTASRAMVVTLLFRIQSQYPAYTANAGGQGIAGSFNDVPADSWYGPAVAWGVGQGVVQGYSASTFGPDDPISREQLAVLLYRFAGLRDLDVSAEGSLSRFSDRGSVSSWATEAVSWAVGEGLLQGSGGALDPQGTATRAQLATLLARFCEKYDIFS